MVENTSGLGVGDAGSALIGAGLAKLDAPNYLGLMLIGAGVVLKILVAVLQKRGLDVRGNEG